MASFNGDASRFESKYADTGSYKTHYIEAGEGQPIILIHGGGPGADGYGNWQGCIDNFAAQGRAIVYDMVGFGKSGAPSPDDFTYDQNARTEQLINLIEALGLKDVAVVGNSMGGITSLDATIRRPDLVSKLILMGSAGIKSDRGIPAALKPLMEYDFTDEGMIKVMQALTNKDFEIDKDMVRYRVDLSKDADLQASFRASMGWVHK
ncbi:MAG: alpha/beta hydrolase, partial [Alphaproteobacteria bacterium]|nr:alpha/beta hydrolase [Alphaproteobacteria bacterium]